MTTSRNEIIRQKLDDLYRQLKQLNKQSNSMMLRTFSIKEDEYASSKESSSIGRNFTSELAKANQEYAESQISIKYDKLIKDIEALEIELYGKPLGDSPGARQISQKK